MLDCIHKGARLGQYNVDGVEIEAFKCNKLGKQCCSGSNALGLIDCTTCVAYEDYPSSIRPCEHRGEVVRTDISNLCGARGKEIEIHKCAIHGECAMRRYCHAQKARVCVGCDDALKRKLQNPVRHLAYHIYPRASSRDAWEWNISQLINRIDLFNGIRSIGIVTDATTAPMEEVKRKFGDQRIDNWIVKANDPAIREGVTFVDLMETLPRGRDDLTFYAHARGVRYDDPTWTRKWSEVMYSRLLDDWPLIHKSLENLPITGCFKRTDEFQLANHFRWHYSGTFFWFRNYETFNRDGWNDLATNFFAGVEAWPSRIFSPSEANCLHGLNPGNLYEPEAWKRLEEVG